MKSTVIIYTALVLVGTATGISIQQPSIASKGIESTNPMESRTSKKLQQIRQHGGGGEEIWGACCLFDPVPGTGCSMVSYWPDDEHWCEMNGGTFYENMHCNEIECEWAYGSCCLSNGDCIEDVASTEDCSELYGVWFYFGMDCDMAGCKPLNLDCCVPGNDTCLEMNAYNCYALGGTANWYGHPDCNEMCSITNSPCDEVNIFSNVASILGTSGCQGLITQGIDYWVDENNFFSNGQEYKVLAQAEYREWTGGGNQDWDDFWAYTSYKPEAVAVTNSEYGEINGATVLNLKTVDFTNVIPNDGYGENSVASTNIKCLGYYDVTQDGKADAIIQIRRNGMIWDGGDYQGRYLCYLENLSESSGAVCASDLNGDGSVEVNDVIQVISDWGPCE